MQSSPPVHSLWQTSPMHGFIKKAVSIFSNSTQMACNGCELWGGKRGMDSEICYFETSE